jgi:hypothetical protein
MRRCHCFGWVGTSIMEHRLRPKQCRAGDKLRNGDAKERSALLAGRGRELDSRG